MKSVTTALWPVPIHRFPLAANTGVPPTRVANSEIPSRSTNGPSGLRERPANTAYPVSWPPQQFADEPIR